MLRKSCFMSLNGQHCFHDVKRGAILLRVKECCKCSGVKPDDEDQVYNDYAMDPRD